MKIMRIMMTGFLFLLLFLFLSSSSSLSFIKAHLLTCPSKHFLHIDCPGCGMQRSIIALLEGDWMKSLSFYPATIPLFALFVYTALHLKMDFKQGASIIKWGYIACAVIIIAFYIYKIITHKIIEL